MGITISSSSSSEDSVKINSKKSQRFETKEARRADRETRKVEREARREARKNKSGGEVSIPENTPSTPPASANTGSSQSSSTQTTSTSSSSTTATPSKSKPFSIGDLNGANVVNFAVQGKAGGSSDFSVFASGKGPGAIDPTQKVPSSTTTATTTSSATPEANKGTTVNTTA